MRVSSVDRNGAHVGEGTKRLRPRQLLALLQDFLGHGTASQWMWDAYEGPTLSDARGTPKWPEGGNRGQVESKELMSMYGGSNGPDGSLTGKTSARQWELFPPVGGKRTHGQATLFHRGSDVRCGGGGGRAGTRAGRAPPVSDGGTRASKKKGRPGRSGP